MTQIINPKLLDIINKNIYLTLWTSDWSIPRVSTLYYCIDLDINFYFISLPGSKHIQNILNNKNVAFSIFDSHQDEWTWDWVQWFWIVTHLSNKIEIKNALQYYNTKLKSISSEDLIWDNNYNIYKLQPIEIYVWDTNSKIDKRIKVFEKKII